MSKNLHYYSRHWEPPQNFRRSSLEVALPTNELSRQLAARKMPAFWKMFQVANDTAAEDEGIVRRFFLLIFFFYILYKSTFTLGRTAAKWKFAEKRARNFLSPRIQHFEKISHTFDTQNLVEKVAVEWKTFRWQPIPRRLAVNWRRKKPSWMPWQ